MRTFFDCIPCFVRQALDTIRRVTDDEAVHEQLLREILPALGKIDMHQAPPAMAQRIHRLIRKLTGTEDPYRDIKDHFNQLALEVYPKLKKQVEDSDKPMEMAVRFAIAGNIIDLGVKSHLPDSDIHDTIKQAMTAPLTGNVAEFSEAVANAQDILFLTDNAGEIVFDRLLIELLPLEKVTVAVRGFPIINDATMVDAEVAGLTTLVEVIDNGTDAPGTVLRNCSESFRKRFDRADFIISKGQGNYETLNGEDKDIFFIFKVKCPMVARDTGYQIGSQILQRSTPIS
ncbi:DUF89 domain-containing protein [Planctomycetota bacterium]